MKVFNDEAALALATLSVDQLVRTKGSGSATDGQTILWRIAASGVGITLANGNVAIALVNDKSGRKNQVFNPNMDIWQRGTTGLTGKGYAADRKHLAANRTAEQSTDVPVPNDGANPLYSMKVVASGGAGSASFYETVELPHAGDAGPFIPNSDWTYSIWVKATVGVNIQLAWDFSVGAQVGGVNVIQSLTTIEVATGDWQRIKQTVNVGSVVPTSTRKVFQVTVLCVETNGTAWFTHSQLEKGTVATEFEYRPIAEELALCQRYYWEETLQIFTLKDYSDISSDVMISYPVEMRSVPTALVTKNYTGVEETITSKFYRDRFTVVAGTTRLISAISADAEL